MEVIKTKLSGVLLVKPDVFEDFRGSFTETYNEEKYVKAGIAIHFVEDDMSFSMQNVLRGIHVEGATKLVSCGYGRLYCVVVNCNETSPDFGKWESFILTDRNRHQILVPPKHGVAHLVLSDWGMFHYKKSGYYDPSTQGSYRWNDPKFNIWWPIKDPIVSQRDEEGKYV
jgi:dTDP-4-dehydrorhamnose 3,5-epimerase